MVWGIPLPPTIPDNPQNIGLQCHWHTADCPVRLQRMPDYKINFITVHSFKQGLFTYYFFNF
jgi:hypothetical protein